MDPPAPASAPRCLTPQLYLCSPPLLSPRLLGRLRAGWQQTGHNTQSRVEFYTRPDGVKMDYYPTTGTVKTSLQHPTQGATQMFRRDLSEAEFVRVREGFGAVFGSPPPFLRRRGLPASTTRVHVCL